MLRIVFFESARGSSPVREYISEQDGAGAAAILEAIKALAEEFPLVKTVSIKHLDGKIWEIRVQEHRVLYAVLTGVLALLGAFKKKSQKTPKGEIETAQARLKKMED